MSAGSTAPAQSPAVPDAAPAQVMPFTRRRWIVILIAVVWCGALAGLVLTSANPLTLNRRQILDAAAVVTVQIVDRPAGECRVTRQWTGAPLPEQINVQQLSETAATAEGQWILPLDVRGGRLQVLPSLLPSGARLVYPATPDAVRQLEAILADDQRR